MNDRRCGSAVRERLSLFAVLADPVALGAVVVACLATEEAWCVVAAVGIWAALGGGLWAAGRAFSLGIPMAADELSELRGLAGARGAKKLRLLCVPTRGGRKEYRAACVHVAAPPRVYLSAGLMEALDASQLRAVFAHELAHLELGHSRKGFALWLLADLAAVLGGAGAFVALEGIAGLHISIEWIAAVGACVFVRELLRSACLAIRRRHELAADRRAVEITGDLAAFASAYRRLAELSGAAVNRPSVERRIQAAAAGTAVGRPVWAGISADDSEALTA